MRFELEEIRALEAEIARLKRDHLLVQIGLVAAAGGKIEVRPSDLYHAPDMVLNRYERPTDGAVVFNVERTPRP